MTNDEAAKQMYAAIVNFSGVCVVPCEHDDCHFLLSSAAAYREIDPSVDLITTTHPRIADGDIKALEETNFLV